MVGTTHKCTCVWRKVSPAWPHLRCTRGKVTGRRQTVVQDPRAASRGRQRTGRLGQEVTGVSPSSRYAQFYSQEDFCHYNMFNQHFFQGGEVSWGGGGSGMLRCAQAGVSAGLQDAAADLPGGERWPPRGRGGRPPLRRPGRGSGQHLLAHFAPVEEDAGFRWVLWLRPLLCAWLAQGCEGAASTLANCDGVQGALARTCPWSGSSPTSWSLGSWSVCPRSACWTTR